MSSKHIPFKQEAPQLGNQYIDDRVLHGYLRRVFGGDLPERVADTLDEMGHDAGGRLYQMQLRDRENEPRLTRWDAWGHRVDRIEVTELWQEAKKIAAERGVVATAYEDGEHPRVHQFALAYLFIPSTDVYGCPLAMTDGAARTLLEAGTDDLIERAVPRLTSRDPERFWTSGQWMTELAGGSDVGRSRTTAHQDESGAWRLHGRKWFTSAINARMALALARPEKRDSNANSPEGTASGGSLALFFVPIRDANGLADGLRVNRLKDKLGTRKLPTAELQLDGARAVPVGGLSGGTRAISPMLNVTRTWNAVTAVALMRRGLALARDYAGRREAFGKPLADQPLHADTLAGLQSTFEAAFHLSFRTVELLEEKESGTLSGDGRALLRLLTPLAKLTTGRQVMDLMPEILEAFGGAGYVEDTGLPALERDAQVLPIWEGTTNVLSLDLLRALEKTGGLAPIEAEVRRCAEAASAPALAETVGRAQTALERAGAWLAEAQSEGRDAVEAGARRFALTLGRVLEAALLARHAQWALRARGDARPQAAARRFAATGLSQMADAAVPSKKASHALANATSLEPSDPLPA